MSLIHKNRAVFKSLSCEWRTPQGIFDQLNEEFRFELDVCATRENARCQKYITPEVDALTQRWAPARCWMNPPYGPDLKRWIEKAYLESGAGATVVCLVPSRTDTIWWHEFALKGEIRFLRGRLRFGDGKWKATFPSVVVIFRPRVKSDERT